MQLILHSYSTAEENLAYEEWLFHHFSEPSLRLWINPAAVVVGKHQNATAEANIPYCLDQGIPVVRRISGGGTVYHDPGNINFSFFRPVDAEKMIDYERNLLLIQEALHNMGYPVEMNARHDLFLNAHKVSGNAQHLRRGRALHHGTILYDADREALSKGIRRSSGTYIDKSVKSVRSPIANLSTHRSIGTSKEFMQALSKALQTLGMHTNTAPLPKGDALQTLINERYAREDWNYGYSPKYTMSRKNATYEAHVNVERGGELSEFELIAKQGAALPTGQPALFFPTVIKEWVEQQTGLNSLERSELMEVLL